MQPEQKDHFRRQVALLGKFAALVKSWELEFGSLGHTQSDPVRESIADLNLMPRVRLEHFMVYCNQACLNLSRKPTTMRLFEVFCSAPHYECSSNELIAKVYRIFDLNQRPERFVESLHCNLIKLISRARSLASRHLSKAAANGIEWFVYDQERKIWALYRLRHEYLSECLERLSLN